jgi:HEAT repeat protein
MRKLVPVVLVGMGAWLIGGENTLGPRPASAPLLSQHEIEALDSMEPADQVKLLVERAMNQYQGALEQIQSRLQKWTGKLEPTPEVERILSMAYNANDLRIREAAIDISLVAHHIERTEAQADKLRSELLTITGIKASHLWYLGLLGHKGIERQRAFDTLVTHAGDANENTRYWAVEAMAYMGSDDVIEPLLRIMHDDHSPTIRERAACGLAQSGMLTSEQRKKAVPALLRYTDDAVLDEETRKWAFQALRDITGQSLPEDPTTWRNWHSKQ